MIQIWFPVHSALNPGNALNPRTLNPGTTVFLPLLFQIGSFFTRADNVGTPVEVMAQNARMGSRKLQSLSPAERAEAINFIADALVDRQEELLRVNKKDLAKVSYLLRFAKDKYASL